MHPQPQTTASHSSITNTTKLIQKSSESRYVSIEDVWSHNSAVPEDVDACLHAFIKRTVWESPDSQAVCSWDENLTYKQLDERSSTLAYHLMSLGIQVGNYVLLSFEKSPLVPIAILAVMKAGGISIALDSPGSQLDNLNISTPVSISLCLSSKANSFALRDQGLQNILVLDTQLLLDISGNPKSCQLPKVSPSSGLFATIEISSNGLQKVALITHSQFSSAVVYQQKALGFSKNTRTIDCVSYASPVAWCYILHTLSCGGCICMPSPRRDSGISLPSSAPGNANCAFITPDWAQDLNHEDISTIVQVNWLEDETSLSGFSPRQTQLTIFSAYGCAKLASVIPIGKTIMPYTAADQILFSDSSIFDGDWKVDAIKASLQTLSSDRFSSNNTILSEPLNGVCLWIVDINDPTSLAPIGSVGELWVEGPLISQGYADEEPFFVENPQWLVNGSHNHPGRTGRLYRTGVQVKYRPDGTIQLWEKELESKFGSMSLGLSIVESELRHPDCGRHGDIPNLNFIHDAPQDEAELAIQDIWAETLRVDPGIIDRECHFFNMGANRVHAMLMSNVARSSGLCLTTRDVFKYPLLKDMTESHRRHRSTADREEISTTTLAHATHETRFQVSQLCNIDESRVLDILPCTALQEGLLALTAKHPRDYVAKNVFKVGRNVDITKLREAWNVVIAMNPILRTRMVSLPEHGVVQVVLAEEARWCDDSLENDTAMGLGTPLTRLSILSQNGQGEMLLSWELHHALYDGWSINLLLKDVEDVYYGNDLQELESMDRFLHYITTIDENAKKDFWRLQFAGTQGIHFPTPKMADGPRPDQRLEVSVDNLDWANSDYTPSTMLRAAWSIVSGHNTSSNEAIFGVTVTGRQVPVPGIERMVGPTIATLPLYISLDWEQDVESLLRSIQLQSTEMIPFEQTGLQHIRRLSEEADIACNFQTLLVVQPRVGDDATKMEQEFLTEFLGQENANKWQDFSTYGLLIECQLETNGIHLYLGFDSTMVPESKMAHIADNLVTVIRQLANERLRKQTVRNFATEALTPYGLDKIWNWNKAVPEPAELCVHDLIAQRVQDNPAAPAICAWDGELTYGQLAEISENLAHRLVGLNVRGCIVPLYFEKSMWMPVAALAVMKAGAAGVAVDMKLPEDRVRSLVSQIKSPVVLASTESQELARRLAVTADVMVVGSEQDSLKPSNSSTDLPRLQPSDTLYVVFTSGSTGTPKGAMVSHGNFCSAIKYQQKPLMFSSSSRVFDFSSYAFDASWCNLIHALTCGGCLCIPSAFERENQLAQCLKKYNITTVDFTPSVARILGPDILSDLTTLILGGEAVVPADAFLAGDKTTIINVYGPAECTPTVALSEVSSKGIAIGRGAGVCTWVVDVNNPQQLAPLGEIGELWVEGPLVGQGYLANPDKSVAAFVQDPAWLCRGAPGHHGRAGRVYRTGDLVRYTDSGELLFVGRKDTQVKIRGQRVELEDIEHHVANSMNTVRRDEITALTVVVETIRPKEAKGAVLVAFVMLECADVAITDEVYEKMVQAMALESSERLQERIPIYMVPTSYIPIFTIPMTPTGKTDRRQLREIAASAWKNYRNTSDKTAPDETLNDVEKLLQKIWMSVLNLSVEETSVNKGFTRIGGDSISAMQVVAQCRQHNIAVTVADILQSATIRKLAPHCKPISRLAVLDDDEEDDEETTESFDLSPIQQLFFDAYPAGLNHFNQSFVLELGSFVPTSKFLAAIQDLVDRHAILRNRFHRPTEGTLWKQSIAPKGPSSFAFAEHNISNRDEITLTSQWRQENLDIENGPVFACDLFNIAGDVQLVTLSAHHLVVDLVSWRIIWGDIEDHINYGKLTSPPSTSWKSWLRRQIKANRHASPLTVLPYSVPLPELDFWRLPLSENTFSNCTTFVEAFEPPVTNAIFGDANECLRTEPMDILLGAMAHSFHQVFPERSVPVIWIEGHGREHSEDLPVDISGTVGWFTTVHPVPILVKPGDSIIEAIRLAKDTRRKVPGKGQPYFACRYYSESGREAAKGQDVTEVTFNFTGRFQQLEAEEGLFKRPDHLGENDSDVADVSHKARRLTMIEINADVEEDWLLVSFQVHRNMSHHTRLQNWTQVFGRSVQSAVAELSATAVSFTLSDLPLLPMSYGALDTLLGDHLPSLGIQTEDIVEILPCSPLQEGILLSSEKQAASYAIYSTWRCLPTDGAAAKIETEKLRSAWSALVKRHTILSTVFALHPEGEGFIQVVLRDTNRDAKLIHSGRESPDTMLNNLEQSTFATHEPQRSFTICESDDGEVACRLDISHALVDGASMSVILQDLVSLYDGIMPPEVPPFGDMIRHISSIPRDKRIAPWTAMLDGVDPCEFPLSVHISNANASDESHSHVSVPPLPLSEVSRLCKTIGITRAVFFQVAWAMVLSHFTGMDEVCFGYLASGRDAPLDGITSMVGPLANLLISRINLRDSPRHVLETVSEKSIQHLAMQHASLAEIQHKLGISGKKLFNTSLSIRESGKSKSLDKRSLSFESSAGEDPHEFDISLSAIIDGDNLDLVVEYREPFIQQQVATQARDVLSAAVSYLLQSNDDSISTMLSSHYSLCGGFYKHMAGADEATSTSFWRDQFQGTVGAHFPQPPTAGDQVREYNEVVLFQKSGVQPEGDMAPATYIRAAWAIIAAKMLDSTEAIFGAMFGHDALLPVRIPIDWEQNVNKLLQFVQKQGHGLEEFKRTGIQRIRRTSADASLACDFQSIISLNNDDLQQADWTNFALLLKYNKSHNGSHVSIKFDSNIFSANEATRLFYQFEHVHQQLRSATSRELKLQDLSMSCSRDLQDIWNWNANLPKAIRDNIPHMIRQTVRQQPSAVAIHSWDGSLTYQQLDDLSAILACQLRHSGVQNGDMIPLCFDKSMWMPVAALAVMKAGGACIATDPSNQPEERLRAMAMQVQAKTILTSETYRDLAGKLGADHVMCVDIERIFEFALSLDREPCLPEVAESDILYIIFTSGSTGVPKGAMVTHGNFCSAIVHQRELLGFESSSRVLDFSSYAFDVAWSNMLHTLTAGGCLCIPSAEERQDSIAGCLEKYDITVSDFTPSVLRNIEPKAVLMQLSTLLLGGEVVLPSDAQHVREEARVVSAYGPAECTPTSMILHLNRDGGGGLGLASGLCTWVVDTDNPAELAAIGTVGELWLEGPLVGAGYINNPEKTKAAYIDDPEWLVRGIPGQRPGRHGRVYRTGDLVQYREDGSLLFKGRKDTQVKIRGQRVELEEVEHYVHDAISAVEVESTFSVVAETIKPQGNQGIMLVAFVSIGGEGELHDDDHEKAVRKATAGVMERLDGLLPAFMIPGVFIPVRRIPMTATGKTDRRQLRAYGSSLTSADIGALNRADGERRAPTNDLEELMQGFWAEVLNMDPDNIGIDDSFFRIGGDSIGAMKLAGLARKSGLSVAVGDVFKRPIMRDLCTLPLLR